MAEVPSLITWKALEREWPLQLSREGQVLHSCHHPPLDVGRPQKSVTLCHTVLCHRQDPWRADSCRLSGNSTPCCFLPPLWGSQHPRASGRAAVSTRERQGSYTTFPRMRCNTVTPSAPWVSGRPTLTFIPWGNPSVSSFPSHAATDGLLPSLASMGDAEEPLFQCSSSQLPRDTVACIEAWNILEQTLQILLSTPFLPM